MLATKVHNKMHDGPGGSGLSRRAILNSSIWATKPYHLADAAAALEI